MIIQFANAKIAEKNFQNMKMKIMTFVNHVVAKEQINGKIGYLQLDLLL